MSHLFHANPNAETSGRGRGDFFCGSLLPRNNGGDARFSLRFASPSQQQCDPFSNSRDTCAYSNIVKRCARMTTVQEHAYVQLQHNKVRALNFRFIALSVSFFFIFENPNFGSGAIFVQSCTLIHVHVSVMADCHFLMTRNESTCWLFVMTAQTYSGASSYCTQRNGHLAVLYDTDVYTQVTYRIRADERSSFSYWIALRRNLNAMDGTWRWPNNRIEGA